MVKIECVRCGNCCRWAGYVRLTDHEIDRIAHCLGLPVGEFIEQYTQLTTDRTGLSLIERDDGSCVLLQGDNVCRIQEAKPRQCVGFPNTWQFSGIEKECAAVARHVREEDTPA